MLDRGQHHDEPSRCQFSQGGIQLAVSPIAEQKMPSIALCYYSFWCRAACLYCQMLILLIAEKVYSFRQSENALTPLMNSECCLKPGEVCFYPVPPLACLLCDWLADRDCRGGCANDKRLLVANVARECKTGKST